jgi:iron only hydrogenase large subunit-like protein
LTQTFTYEHTIYFEPSKCNGEMACLKICPVEAVRIRNSKAKMLEDKCIDCGVCVKACKSNAIIPLTNTTKDFSKFKYTVAIPSLALYSQFERNIHPRSILSALKKAGFDEVVDTTKSCVTIYKAIDKYIKNYTGKKPLIVTFCTTVLKLIQTSYPELLGNVIPVISPMELTARETKQKLSKQLGLKKDEIGIIYITPCPSKMMMISNKQDKYYSDFDGAIPVSDIYSTIYTELNRNSRAVNKGIEHYEIDGFGLNLGMSGGLASLLGRENYFVVSGINDVIDVLEDIEYGKLKDVNLVEMESCTEGCLNGSMVVDNMYMARNKMMHLIKLYGVQKIPVGKKEEQTVEELFYNNFFEQTNGKKNNGDLSEALTKISERKEIYSNLPKIDCGACGSPSCLTFAEDVVNGDVKMNDCIFVFNDELKLKLKEKMLQVLDLQNKLDLK